MSTNQQRREAERRRLQRQLEERREREAARKRFTLVASIVTTLVVIAAVVVVVIVATSGGSDDSAGSGGGGGSAATVTFQGVTVGNADDISAEPKVTSKATKDPTALQYKDLVVGKGKAASSSATVTVQYTGVLYKNGKQFDSSWSSGQPAKFSLAQVVPGFTQGIGGTAKVPPMKVGGRRLMILPAALGYGSQANGAIPANSTLVFVVDLKSIDG